MKVNLLLASDLNGADVYKAAACRLHSLQLVKRALLTLLADSFAACLCLVLRCGS